MTMNDDAGATPLRDPRRAPLLVGAAMTPFGKLPDHAPAELVEAAVRDALADAGAEAKDIGAVWSGSALLGLITGQESVRGQVAMQGVTGLRGVPVYNVENACATSSSALELATHAVAAGAIEVGLVVGFERLTGYDKEVVMAAFDSAVDVARLPEIRAKLGLLPGGARTHTLFMDIYAQKARAFSARTGAGAADYARVVEKNRLHGTANPKAQWRSEIRRDEVLAARTIVDPLTLPMCSPLSDGAAALVVASPAWARRHGADGLRLAIGVATGLGDAGGAVSARAARLAYERAGIGPGDFDLVELHDATAPAELIAYEELGLCPDGEAARLLADGVTAATGALPVNVSGGLISRGHPVGATGAAQIVELRDQLLGRAGARQIEGARAGAAHNAGGWLGDDVAVACVSVVYR